MAKIAARGKLIVRRRPEHLQRRVPGPVHRRVQGFDIDMAKDIAQAIFGDRTPSSSARSRRTSASRAEDGDVDIVVRTMSITCEPAQRCELLRRVLRGHAADAGEKNSGISGVDQLAVQTGVRHQVLDVAEQGSRQFPSKPIPVQVSDWTDCLVMLQQGQIDRCPPTT